VVRYKDNEHEKIKSETRRSLLDAAIVEFAREGYEGANINRISQAAGFAKGTIYNYFDSKRALMITLIEETAGLHLEFITEQVYRHDDASRRVELFFEAGFAFASTYLAHGSVMVNNLYGPDAEFKEVMYQAYLPMFELLGKDIIALGISQGIFRQMDPTHTASMLMMIYLGIASQVNEEGKPWVEADQVAGLVLNGLLNQPRAQQSKSHG